MSDGLTRFPHSQGGASLLLELCVVSLCLGLLFFGLMPGLSGVSSRYQSVQFIERLVQSIQLAKNEALALGRPMILCGSADGKTCIKTRNWGLYWLVGELTDISASPAPQLAKIVQVYSISPPNQLAFGDSTIGVPRHDGVPAHYLIIKANGQTYNNGSFTYTYFENGQQKNIKLTLNHLLRTYSIN